MAGVRFVGTLQHDGSSRYVSDPYPALGDRVTLWVRSSHVDPPSRLHARWLLDAEPQHAELRVDRRDASGAWWRVEVPVANPVVSYRFLVEPARGEPRWLTALGQVAHDPPDCFDFRLAAHPAPPGWAADAVAYEVFLDRFADSGAPRDWPGWARRARWDDPVARGDAAMTQVFGGDLWGLRDRLDYLERLGVGLLYLTPFFPAPSNHRYNAETFDRVDPLLGGDDALVALCREARRRGMRVIGDLTTNHCGSTHEWFRAAASDPDAPEAGYFHRDADGEIARWLDVPTLPKFDHRDEDLRKRLYEGLGSAAGRWIAPPFELDGWRIDVANMTGRFADIDVNRSVARALRETLRQANPEAVLLAEHAHDASADLDGDGWHGAMNYAGFTRPAWSWLGRGDPDLDFLGYPHGLRRRGGHTVAASIQQFRAVAPWRSTLHNLNLLSSHDTARIRTVTGSDDLAAVAAAMLLTSPGIPMLFAGDELGVEGADNESARQPMPWHRLERPPRLLGAYERLVRLRRSHPALRHGGCRWLHVGDDALVFAREGAGERLVVQLRRATGESARLPAWALDGARRLEPCLDAEPLTVDGDGVALPGDGPAASAWIVDDA